MGQNMNGGPQHDEEERQNFNGGRGQQQRPFVPFQGNGVTLG